MEQPVFVQQHHGVLRLPPGFRFHPTDEELVVQYLKRKVFSCPLPASVIPEIDLGKYDPWDLPGVLEGEKYFFNHKDAKQKSRNGDRPKRAAGSGFWKVTGKDKPVVASGQVVGMKKVMVFHRGKPCHGARTDWIMHEYSLQTRWSSDHISMFNNTKDWVVCRVFKKKGATKLLHARIMKQESDLYREQHMNRIGVVVNSGGASASPASSCVTDLSEESSDGDEGNNSKHVE